MIKEMLNRRHVRKTGEHQPIQMVNLNSQTFYVLPADESEGGLGAIYTGKKPPEIAAYYSYKEGNKLRHVEVRWVKKISDGIFRLGLQYIKVA
jgi:hypothetical protein